MRCSSRMGLLVVLASLSACQVFVGDYEADLVAETSISSAGLCEVERSQFAFELDLDSSDALADLTAYYDAANPELIAHLEAVAQSYHAGSPGAAVTYMMGTAGVGKSFAARNIIDGFEDTETCRLKPPDLFYDDAALLGFPIEDKPDLRSLDGTTVFNELPSIADVSAFELDALFEAAGCRVEGTLVPMIIIDDLDEVHDETCAAILRAVDEFVLGGAQGAGAFVHILVVGRPEGFYTWLADPARNEQNNAIVDLFTLQPPRYRTAGDLDLRIRGYLDFSNQLDALEASGELGAFIETVTAAIDAHPFLTYSMGILSVGNVVVEHTRPGLNNTEQQIKTALFDDIMLRGSKTHGRPVPGSALGGPYLRALEDIAARYVDVGSDGVFSVRSEDTVTLSDDEGESIGQVRVRDVLNRAGVALHSTATSTTARYRFDPFWVHGHLVERRNQRSDTAYAYRPCE